MERYSTGANLSLISLRGLMVQEDLDRLGLGASEEYQRVQPDLGKRERDGFVAGTGVRSSGKGFFW